MNLVPFKALGTFAYFKLGYRVSRWIAQISSERSERFQQTARDLGIDEAGGTEALDRALEDRSGNGTRKIIVSPSEYDGE